MRADPTDSERRAFIAWYNSDASHRDLYQGLDRLWEATARSGIRSSLADAPGSVPKRVPRRRAYAVAAALVASIGLAGLVLNLVARQEPEQPEVHLLLVATSIGEIRQVSLPDGSRITLDTDTAVEVKMGEAKRRVELRKGRARFAVAADMRPFEVAAGASLLKVSTAVFDVSMSSGRTHVAAIQGTIAVEGAAEGAVASPFSPSQVSDGDEITVGPTGAEPARPISGDVASWPRGMLEFDSTSLGDAAAEANRYSREKILIADRQLARLEVTGVFRAGDTAGLVRALGAAFRLRIERTSDGSYLLHPGSP